MNRPTAMALMSPPELLGQLMSEEALNRLRHRADFRGSVFEDISSAEAQALLPDVEVLITGWGCPPISPEILDQAALEAELVSGRLNANPDVSAPDVLPPGHRFYDLPKVFLTPHIAGSMGTELLRISDHGGRA